MHRVGAAPADAVRSPSRSSRPTALRLAALCTHCAVADEPDDPSTAEQLDRFDAVVRDARRPPAIDPPLRHAANSAGCIAHPAARFDLVRAGIALYGIAPGPGVAGTVDLRPGACRLRGARSSLVKPVPAGDARVATGCATVRPRRVVATVPVGYADGVPRRLGRVGGEVLIGGRRRPIARRRDDGPADRRLRRRTQRSRVGDEVVLLGRQGDEAITAEEWADRLGTIGYEIVCGIGPRVPRRTVRRPT